ncbi:tyrosine--tRNA ligase [Longimicrobium sp.]|uniref:tyrosine--tRNA ligase n=1 Tax=Longimicrobium sp. TaxID=2029185 RepID=UPI002F947AAB
MPAANLYEELKSRGLLFDATEGARAATESEKLTAYIGFDPTAASLHVGSLLPVMALVHLQRHGHTPIAIVGGGTGMIGDPSGKTAERKLQTREQVAENMAGLRGQLERFLDFTGPSAARVIDNGDWLTSISFVDFLRDVGKHFTINYMTAKESVKRRLEQEEGLSYTEFSYMLLQSYDYLVLNEREGCLLQLGGSDQWGNITAGIELIRRVRGVRAHGMVMPLVTTSAGVKFGKTEAGTIWLDASLTSPYRFYQFWLNTDDQDVEKYLKYFTLLPVEEIDAAVQAHTAEPHRRTAQRLLAAEVTRTVHGADELARAERASALLFGGGSVQGLSAAEIGEVLNEVPSSDAPAGLADGVLLSDMVMQAGFASSRAEARRLIAGGGLYLNDTARAADDRVTREDAIEGQVIVLRKGKRSYHVIRCNPA